MLYISVFDVVVVVVYQDLEKELAEIKEATIKLTERAVAQGDKSTSKHGVEEPPVRNAAVMDTEISRLIEERDTLLQTG